MLSYLLPDSFNGSEELTDEDIVQLTREYFRRYLKEKGLYAIFLILIYSTAFAQSTYSANTHTHSSDISFSTKIGMCRPFWNKSQAIQQVLSLKILLDSKLNQNSKKPSKHKPNVSLPLCFYDL